MGYSNTGCLNACTYCKTKHARGQLGSYTIEEILNRSVVDQSRNREQISTYCYFASLLIGGATFHPLLWSKIVQSI